MNRLIKSLLAATALTGLALPASANPLGGQVVGGNATVQGQGTATVTVTQSTDRAIINWQSFNIGTGELTQFLQPSSSSVTLNRVIGHLGPSAIDGTLTANGRIFLVNPDGVLFGANAKINTGGFLATTNDIKNADFMAGNYRFGIPGRPDASIVNLGTITAANGGFAALVAPGVRNAGTITATLGSIGLSAGNKFSLDFYGDKLITLAPGDAVAAQVKDVATGLPLDALVKNEGALKANGGKIELTSVAARQVVDAVINNKGVIEANSIGTKNGMIVLGAQTAATKPDGAPAQRVVVSGRISAAGRKAGTKGGTIQITGEDIKLANARVNASGRAGGGTVLIGGDVGGGKGNAFALASLPQAALQPWSVPAATRVSVDAASVIDASARDVGRGGKVVVWADGATQFAGTIVARGGAEGGRGGFAEVSGHKLLAFTGSVDLRAQKGLPGLLLLDPADYYIIDSEGTAPAGASVMLNTVLQNQLALGDVLIMTDNAAAPAGQHGDIFVNANVSWDTDYALRMIAYRNIEIANGVTITNTYSPDLFYYRGDRLLLAAGVSFAGATPVPTGVGTVIFNGTGKIDFSQSSGHVYFAYNPPGGYANPTDYSAVVLTNPQWTPVLNGWSDPQFAAHMWVNTVADLQNINQNLAGSYVVANLDASATATWNNGAGFIPIGTIDAPFTGRLNGAGGLYGDVPATITNLKINSPADYVGLFGVVGNRSVLDWVSLPQIFYPSIDNITLVNANITATSTNAVVGGIAGLNRGVINSSSVSGLVRATNAGAIVGGMGGYNLGSVGDSFADATVSGGLSTIAGGLFGKNSGAIVRSYAEGNVSGGNRSTLGGLIGQNSESGFVGWTYATGAVSGNGASLTAGGLIGENDGYVLLAYASGLVSATGGQPFPMNRQLLGGFIGANGVHAQAYGYWDIQTTGQSSGGGSSSVIGLTTAQARQQSSYAGWDFSLNWFMVDGVTRPFLRSEWSPVVANAHQLQLAALAPSSSYLLANNIDLGPALANPSDMWGPAGFAPIGGNGSSPFNGVFAGQGYTISNLTINSTQTYTGLFGFVGQNGIVSGVNLVDANVNARQRDGSGWVGAMAGYNAGLIELSSASGQVSSGTSYDVGGFVGRNVGTISLSFANVTTVGGNNSAIGGFAGANYGGTITQSFSLGAVQAGQGSAAGGLVGIASSGLIDQTYAAGLVTAPNASTGGLVAWGGATITNSYWDTLATAQSTSGGGTPLTTQQFQAGLPVGFDPGVWQTAPVTPYPQLGFGASPNPTPTPDPGAPPPSIVLPPAFVALPTNFTNQTLPAPPSNDPVLGALDSPQGSGAGGGQGGQGGSGGGGGNGGSNGRGGVGTSGPPPGNGVGRTPSEQQFSGVPPLNENRFVPNEVLVQFSNQITPEQIQQLARELGLTIIGSQGVGLGNRTAYRLLLPDGMNLRDVIAKLEQKNVVASAGPNYTFALTQSAEPTPQSADRNGRPVDKPPEEIETTSSVTTTPDLAPQRTLGQYTIGKLKLDSVHRRVRGDNVLVAVIDSAIDTNHPDLAGAVIEKFTPGGGENAAPHAHGTGMAGAIASHRQLTGTAPGVRIVAIDAFSGSQGTTFQIIKGLEHAIERNARVVNMSFAGPRDLMLERTLKTAHDKGVVLIAAAGNAGPKSPPLYPAADPNVIAVTATDSEDKVFMNANRGKHVAVAAPGVDILALAPAGGFQLTTGTSVATAHVSGVAALLINRKPTLTPDDVRGILTSSAKTLGRGRNDNTGYGLVDPERALDAVERPLAGRSASLENARPR